LGRGTTSSVMENVTHKEVPVAEKTEVPAKTGGTQQQP
jgi:hypothetical protein